MNVKLLTEHRLEFLSIKECYTGSSESTLVKMPYCWKSHVGSKMHHEHIFFVSPFKTNGISIKLQTIKSGWSIVYI